MSVKFQVCAVNRNSRFGPDGSDTGPLPYQSQPGMVYCMLGQEQCKLGKLGGGKSCQSCSVVNGSALSSRYKARGVAGPGQVLWLPFAVLLIFSSGLQLTQYTFHTADFTIPFHINTSDNNFV